MLADCVFIGRVLQVKNYTRGTLTTVLKLESMESDFCFMEAKLPEKDSVIVGSELSRLTLKKELQFDINYGETKKIALFERVSKEVLGKPRDHGVITSGGCLLSEVHSASSQIPDRHSWTQKIPLKSQIKCPILTLRGAPLNNLYLIGPIMVNQSAHTEVLLYNHGYSRSHWFITGTDCALFRCEPSQGIVEACNCMTIKVIFKPTEVGEFRHDFEINGLLAETTQQFRVTGTAVLNEAFSELS
ncbi:hypothetical protein Ciccas_007213 [Cichlidogyrus casuarinus]|uniref:HYDIN/VesB/CFA65-like Ig-like domain-containing protein n=1 Tax=Cichlidogyrus casuarinus TaxID=1844966 RepID=A0ABD2Q3J9_9PLAT